MRLREPRATALIFASGKMCVTGTKSTHNSTLAAKKFAYIVERVGFKPQTYIDFKVQNIVGTADVGFPIRLEGLVYAHSTFASYEPELFPGLIYRLVSPRVVFLIFVSGKIVITGAKTEIDLSEALTKVFPVLMEFRKVNVDPVPGSATAAAAGGVPPALMDGTCRISAGGYRWRTARGGRSIVVQRRYIDVGTLNLPIGGRSLNSFSYLRNIIRPYICISFQKRLDQQFIPRFSQGIYL